MRFRAIAFYGDHSETMDVIAPTITSAHAQARMVHVGARSVRMIQPAQKWRPPVFDNEPPSGRTSA